MAMIDCQDFVVIRIIVFIMMMRIKLLPPGDYRGHKEKQDVCQPWKILLLRVVMNTFNVAEEEVSNAEN